MAATGVAAGWVIQRAQFQGNLDGIDEARAGVTGVGRVSLLHRSECPRAFNVGAILVGWMLLEQLWL